MFMQGPAASDQVARRQERFLAAPAVRRAQRARESERLADLRARGVEDAAEYEAEDARALRKPARWTCSRPAAGTLPPGSPPLTGRVVLWLT